MGGFLKLFDGGPRRNQRRRGLEIGRSPPIRARRGFLIETWLHHETLIRPGAKGKWGETLPMPKFQGNDNSSASTAMMTGNKKHRGRQAFQIASQAFELRLSPLALAFRQCENSHDF
jgi:hypothetical protein